jgi:hypothetical protein
VADELGTAVLRLELDTSGLKEALAKAKQQVEQELGTATTGATSKLTKPATRTRPTTGAAATPAAPSASIAAIRAELTEKKLNKARTNSAKATERAILTEKKQRAQDIQGRVSSGLIGGAFPLMFGQGGGASIGGLLGGVAGGGPFGFGASLVGTLVGSQIDLLNQRFGDLAKALEDPLANFDAFIEKATLASKAQESLVKALQETGQTTAAAELIRTEASRTIDPIQAQGAVIAQDQFNRALSDTQDVLGAIVSGPATGFLTFLAGVLKTTKEAAAKDPIEASLKTQEKAVNSIGRNIGGILSGTLLAAGGISSLFATGGVSAPVAVPLIGSGLSIASIGAAGATSDNADLAVAQSSEVLAFQLAIVEAKQRQIRVEKEILTATSQGKENLAQQLSVQLQFNALKIQEQQELSKIQQELERNLATPLGNDAEDRAKAIEQEKQLRLAIELRRDALLAAATAGQTQSIKGLSAAKELQGTYGDQRTIVEEQLKLKEAALKADGAQAQLNKLRRTPGADPKEVQAAEADVNAAINRRKIANVEGLDKIQRAQDNIALGAFKEFQAREQISSSIENTLQLLGTEQGQYRDTLGTIQQISATLDAARRKEAEIGFQIDQARVGGRDEEASRLVDRQRTAALETRKLLTESAFELTKAGESLKEASIVARDNLRAAVLEFTRTRSDEQGLNRFLSPQQQQKRAEQDLKLLLPSFREAQSRFTSLTGAKAQEFTGPTADVNAAVRDFIAAVDRESQAGRALGKARENLEQTNKALVEVNMELTKATAALAAKEWLVSVNVVNNANGSSTVDAVNGLTS